MEEKRRSRQLRHRLFSEKQLNLVFGLRKAKVHSIPGEQGSFRGRGSGFLEAHCWEVRQVVMVTAQKTLSAGSSLHRRCRYLVAPEAASCCREVFHQSGSSSSFRVPGLILITSWFRTVLAGGEELMMFTPEGLYI